MDSGQQLDMTENTLQFVIKVFAVLMFVVVMVVLATYVVLVIKDGNTPVVADAYTHLVDFGKWAMTLIGLIIVGKPVASGTGALLTSMASKNNSTANVIQSNATPPVQPSVDTNSAI